MNKKISAGLLMYKWDTNILKVLLGHPGGPFFKNKDLGQWTIPKGEVDINEELLNGAIREFKEETGIEPTGPYIALGSVKRKDGKVIHTWAFESKLKEPIIVKSNTFLLEWPPKSGKLVEFPELDKVDFFDLKEGRLKINAVQVPFLERLENLLKS